VGRSIIGHVMAGGRAVREGSADDRIDVPRIERQSALEKQPHVQRGAPRP
jgi:hypothetical protein